MTDNPKNHTAGPWEYNQTVAPGDKYHDGTDTHIYAQHEIVAHHPDGKHSFTLQGCIEEPDARLAAAAPDLLDALKQIVKCEQNRMKKLLPNSPAGRFSRERMEAAQAAIAKAEGKE